MPKIRTEAQAWRAVGRAIEQRGGMRTRFTGLCFEMLCVLRNDRHDNAREWSYNNSRLRKHLNGNVYAYEGEEWEARCLAAYWLALEAEDDG